ncbi:MAG: SDR family NAD(P)-dependent oxidoreductase [Acidobacteriota bacterium]
METGLTGQVVLITGASGGIGAATARRFAAEGARLVLHSHTRRDTVVRLAAELETDCLPVAADLRREDQVDGLFDQALGRFNALDALVASAGIWPPEPAPIHEMSLERWSRVVATDQTAVFLCARAFFKHLAARRPPQASMVLVGSTAAVFGEADHAAYAAAKAAVTYGLTRTLKNEIVRLTAGGRVNAVCPGWTLTPMAEKEMHDEAAVRSVLQTRSLQAIARADDIASAIVYLASPLLAGHLTGEILTVAGGMEGRILRRPEDVRLPR